MQISVGMKPLVKNILDWDASKENLATKHCKTSSTWTFALVWMCCVPSDALSPVGNWWILIHLSLMTNMILYMISQPSFWKQVFFLCGLVKWACTLAVVVDLILSLSTWINLLSAQIVWEPVWKLFPSVHTAESIISLPLLDVI